MPSPYYYPRPQATHLPHLSEILQLYPEEERWCAGYAPSQRRRCHASTNARNRKTAMRLLDEGTEDLHAGLDIDDLLEDLAPCVLCTRFHQNQSHQLAAKWKWQVQQFWDSFVPPVPPQRAAGQRLRMSSPAISMRSVEIDYFQLEKRVRVQIGEHERRPQSSRTTRSASAASQGSSVIERVTHTASATVRLQELSSRSAAVLTQETTTITRAAAHSSPAGRQVASPATPNSGPSNIPTAAIRTTSSQARPSRSPSRSSSSTPSSTPSSCSDDATRRSIEGDCNICFDSLKTARSAAGVGARPDTELSWCKAQCGVNYHTTCIELWLKTAKKSTCPTCRTAWKR
ncbi:hypothetical protein BDV26DRAFT_256418 [Aspergillus bertholletiae]|uniref:RING-type domain-containing protein n=1 Tax=Aspergillus bertholletiae TaxID=1226010 RepID=A0A5N7BGH0_9EURO|nr:hypothetical protein BDV26DRAFT_256418 [Aspergillus bertholletiae]